MTGRSPDATTSKQCLEEQTIETWRRALNRTPRFTAVTPHDSVFESLRLLHDEHLHGIPVADPKSGDIYHVITHKRILRFLHLFINELPIPAFLYKTLAETRIGTYGAAVAMVTRNDTLLKVLEVIVDRRVTALPVVDERGRVVDVFCKLDMISLAAQEMYHDLSMTLEVALELRFNPIFEIEQPSQLSTADAFTRFSSPKPRRRDFARQNSEGKHRHHRRSHHWSGNDGVTDDVMSRCPPGARAGHVTPPSHERRERPTSHPPSSNHQSHLPTSPLVARTTLPRSNSKQPPSSRASSSPASSVTSDTAGRGPYRHRSVSRHQPLVKCHLSDTLHGIIDMLISTDINMLVVVGEDDDDVIGIVTVADVLNYIVDPYSKHLIPRKLEKEEDARQSASSSASDVTSGDSGSVTSSHRSSTSSGGFRLSTTSDAPNNDSGYTSSVTSSVGFASSTVAVDFRGAQIERS